MQTRVEVETGTDYVDTFSRNPPGRPLDMLACLECLAWSGWVPFVMSSRGSWTARMAFAVRKHSHRKRLASQANTQTLKKECLSRAHV